MPSYPRRLNLNKHRCVNSWCVHVRTVYEYKTGDNKINLVTSLWRAFMTSVPDLVNLLSSTCRGHARRKTCARTCTQGIWCHASHYHTGNYVWVPTRTFWAMDPSASPQHRTNTVQWSCLNIIIWSRHYTCHRSEIVKLPNMFTSNLIIHLNLLKPTGYAMHQQV